MFFVNWLLPSLVLAAVIVPQPSGPYGVSITDYEFVDMSRPYPDTATPGRKIPVSLMAPTGPSEDCQVIQEKYLPDPTANYWDWHFNNTYHLPLNQSLTQVSLSLCQPTMNKNEVPLVLFLPGLGAPRQFYNIIASNIAAQGFAVMTVDAPGWTDFITYLNGTTQSWDTDSFSQNTTKAPAVAQRVQDIEFVLDTLNSDETFPWQQNCSFNASSPAIFGHSLGGSTAHASVLADKRFIGGVDLDGTAYGPALNETTDTAFLMFASDIPGEPHNQNTVPAWAIIWQNLHGPKWQLMMNDSRHNTFTDAPTFGNLLGIYNDPNSAKLVGTIAPQEALAILRSTLSTFAGYVFGQYSINSVSEVAGNFSDVVVVNATNLG